MLSATAVHRRLFISALTLTLAIFSVSLARAASSPPAVSIAQGALSGGSADGVDFFMGIPYAKPPVGDLRWREPQAPANWTGARDATKPGAVCLQTVRGEEASPAPSEDCLFVNVWRPAGVKADAKLPVMLWYHGGGFTGGSGSATNGTHLAQKGVIVVTLNYRLSGLGQFAHPALTAETPNGPTGNYTLMDQVAALKWTRSNIAAFGGNPDNITIFGFSSGAQTINTLMVSPASRGLFAKAITQSGLGRNYGLLGANRILPIRGDAAETGEKIGLAFAEGLGVKGTGADALKALRALPAERFLTIMGPTGSAAGSYIDGILLTESVPQAYAAGHDAPVPQITGRTICERCGVQELIKDPEVTFGRATTVRPRAITLYGGPDANASVEFASDLDMNEPSRYLARFRAAHGRAHWNYVFAHTTESQRGQKSGPSHGDDAPYIFGTLRDAGGRRFEPTAEDLKVSDAIMTYWTNFAKTSDPGSAAGVQWPRFGGPSDENVLVFTSEGPKVDKNFKKDRLDLAEQVNNMYQPFSSGGAGPKPVKSGP